MKNDSTNCGPVPDEDLAVMLEFLAATMRAPAPKDAATAKPLFGWQGGKRWLVKELLPLLPEHRMYVELFCGGGALLCAKPPSAAEVINDKNSELVNLYRIVKFHLDELQREMDWCLNSRRLTAGSSATATSRPTPGRTGSATRRARKPPSITS